MPSSAAPVRLRIVALGCALGMALPGCSAKARAPDAPSPAATVAPPAAPAGYVELTVAGLIAVHGRHAVVLVDRGRDTAVPIFVGGTEALAIGLRRRGRRYARPLTHDLFDALLRRIGGVVSKVQIDKIVDDTFVGSVFVRRGAEVLRLDARPSDAIALALGSRAPIFVRVEVIAQAGIRREQLERGPRREPESI